MRKEKERVLGRDGLKGEGEEEREMPIHLFNHSLVDILSVKISSGSL